MPSKKSVQVPKTIADLKGDPHNPREISPEALAGLKSSIKSFGDLSGIVFNLNTSQLVTGHQRLTSLREEHGEGLEIVVDEKANRFLIKIPGAEDFVGRLVRWPLSRQRMANIAANSPLISGEFTSDLDAQLRQIRAGDDKMFEALRFEGLLDDGGKGGKLKAEVKFAEELGEANNYIVLKFKTETDFLQARTILELESVYSRRRNGQPWSKGVGRVIDGAAAIERIRRSAGK